MREYFAKFLAWIESTHIQEQVANVDYVGLFSNPWFLVPFICLILYFLYTQAFRDLILITAFIGVWWLTGTEYMNSLVVGDELQLNKVLPVLFGGAALVGVIVYMIFGRSD